MIRSLSVILIKNKIDDDEEDFLSLMMCCLLWGTAYSQITYDITGVWGKRCRAGRLECGRWKMVMSRASSWIRWSWLTTERLLYAGKSTRKMCDVDECEEWVRTIFLDGKPLRLTIKESEYSYKNPSGPYVLENETRDQAAAQAMIQFWGDDYIRNFFLWEGWEFR